MADTSRELLWYQYLIHYGEHTLKDIQNHVDGIPNLKKIKFNDITHCATSLKTNITKSPVGHHSLHE